MLTTFDKHDKTQLLAKFKKKLYVGFRAILNFRKLKVEGRGRAYQSFVFARLLLTQISHSKILPSILFCNSCASAEEIREVHFILVTKLKHISSEVRFVWHRFIMENTLHSEVPFVFFVATHRIDINFT